MHAAKVSHICRTQWAENLVELKEEEQRLTVLSIMLIAGVPSHQYWAGQKLFGFARSNEGQCEFAPPRGSLK